MTFTDLNWWAILVGATFTMVLGALWYSRLLFGGLWLRMIRKRQDELGKAGPAYAATTVGALVCARVLAVLVRAAGAASFLAGTGAGGLVWFGIGATGTLAFTVFQGPPLAAWALFSSCELVALAVQGGVFAIWC